MNPATGRALWALLHAYARFYPLVATGREQQHARRWLAAFDQAVVSASTGVCACARHWRAIRVAHPPPLAGRELLVAWTQLVHDEVNVRLGKERWVNKDLTDNGQAGRLAN